MNFLIRHRKSVATATLVVLCIFIFASTIASAYKKRMHDTLPRDSYTRAMMSIGISISRLAHGAEGYSLYAPVISALQNNGFNADEIAAAGRIDAGIQAAVSIKLNASGNRGDLVVRDWGDDKGYSDFTTLAFVLFGTALSSFFWLYFTLLAVTCGLFLVRFRRDVPSLFLLFLVLLAHRLVVDILPNSTVTSVVHDARFLPAISCVAALHLALSPLRPSGAGLSAAALAIGQAALMIFVINSRSSAVWQVMFVISVLAAAAAYRIWWKKERLPDLVPHAIVAAVVLCIVAGMNLHRSINYSEIYKTDGIRTHVFWHNIYMGLGIHPDADRLFGLIPDDSTSYKHVHQYLLASPDAVAQLGIRSEDIQYPLFAIAGWRKYDEAVGLMFRDFVQRNPLYVMQSYFIYKPAYVLDQLSWQVRVRRDFPSWIMLNPVHMPAGSSRIRLYGWPALLLLTIGTAALLLSEGWRPPVEMTALAIVLFAFSLIPSFAVAPFYYELPVVFVVFVVVSYLLFVVAVIFGASASRRSRHP